MQNTKIFEVYSEIVKSTSRTSTTLISPFTKVAHANTCNIDSKSPYQCSDKFSKFWRESHFLADNGFYVYRLYDLSQEEFYIKRKLVAFLEDLGYVVKVFLRDWR